MAFQTSKNRDDQPCGSNSNVELEVGTGSRIGVQAIVTTVSLALAAYALWNIAPMLPVIGPLVSKATEPTNLLERAADLGKSRRPDFDKLVDAGGLEAYPSWHDLKVSNMNTHYGDDGTLTQLALVIEGTSKWSPNLRKWLLDSTSAAPSLVRSVLAQVCASDNWQVMETGGLASKVTSSGKLNCVYNKLNDRSSDIMVTLELSSARAATQPSAVPASAHAVPSDETKADDQEVVQTRRYFEIVRAAADTFATQGQPGLSKASEDCWNGPGSAANKLDCVDKDIAARQVLIASAQNEPAAPFSVDAIGEKLATAYGPAATPALLNKTFTLLNQIMKNLLAQHKVGTVPANLAASDEALTSQSRTQPQRPASLPKFQKGEDYGAVRKKLMTSGWLPFHAKDADTCTNGDARCQGRSEMEACAGTGLAPCKFLWTRGDQKLAICTVGEEKAIFNAICDF